MKLGACPGFLIPWLAIAALTGCGSSGDGADCGVEAQKQWVLDTTYDWYLFDDLLPATVDVAQFPTAADLLDHLTATARAQGKDRFFSFLTTRSNDDALFGEGEFVGFGFRTRTDPGPRVFLLEVVENSPASEGGLVRGDEIVAVDTGSGFVAIADLLAGRHDQRRSRAGGGRRPPGGSGLRTGRRRAMSPSSSARSRSTRCRTTAACACCRSMARQASAT